MGWLMFLVSIIGIAVNLRVLQTFFKQKMTSFYIMCSSKTLSNMIIILGYLLHNAPITIIDNFTGPTFFNMLVNQMVSYGIYLLGPVTQLMISVNRLMVMLFVKKSITQNNQKITVAILVVFWIMAVLITAMGLRDSCNVIYNPELLNWWSGGCDDDIGEAVMGFVILCAILSNLCNLIVVIKLAMSMNKKHLDSESVRRRQAKSRKLFIQNCIQDWLFGIDSVNSTYIDLIYDGILFRFFLDIFSNLMTPVLDGCVMMFFNHGGEKKQSVILSVKKKDTTTQNTGSMGRF
ncbi:hypothetical protein GCK72_007021 [Caenorhabditis remanei]|uniref:7TM GPCR serpentine receptor class x (Srx) domain-containing protein n=1 Tax=Caenorhabditis remanei TaxID=31234 RepID=A0A6A5HL00_CAERE|nr:hypothetical protein GCK72_007021 [Caenorhabditis remanei]KAF1767063.1 hypothetical protein GCK72_007021 [Caenorhabditis remanei]